MVHWPRPRGAAGNPCDGCRSCELRCIAGIQMTRSEFDRIVNHLRSAPEESGRVLDQDKEVVWFEDATVEACLFRDMSQGGCLVYPVRPLICRLFGRVEWLPCPLEKKVEQLSDGVRLIQAYANEERHTFPEWLQQIGLLDFRLVLESE